MPQFPVIRPVLPTLTQPTPKQRISIGQPKVSTASSTGARAAPSPQRGFKIP